ncbi:hypothetical protein AB4Y32_22040 [Paraburkholderia phymatum]|uniref:Uncharacterized protein n=1 Tax=Paraburkholderia phymatum TaxID=148447 RepID=A0ACC6U491_9BURK
MGEELKARWQLWPGRCHVKLLATPTMDLSMPEPADNVVLFLHILPATSATRRITRIEKSSVGTRDASPTVRWRVWLDTSHC